MIFEITFIVFYDITCSIIRMNNMNLLLSMKNIIVKYNINIINGRTINKSSM